MGWKRESEDRVKGWKRESEDRVKGWKRESEDRVKGWKREAIQRTTVSLTSNTLHTVSIQRNKPLNKLADKHKLIIT